MSGGTCAGKKAARSGLRGRVPELRGRHARVLSAWHPWSATPSGRRTLRRASCAMRSNCPPRGNRRGAGLERQRSARRTPHRRAQDRGSEISHVRPAAGCRWPHVARASDQRFSTTLPSSSSMMSSALPSFVADPCQTPALSLLEPGDGGVALLVDALANLELGEGLLAGAFTSDSTRRGGLGGGACGKQENADSRRARCSEHGSSSLGG